MTSAFLESHLRSQPPTVKSDVPNQAEIDREIAKLKEDSEKDVKRQLDRQRVVAAEVRVEKDIGDAVERVLTPVGHAVEAKVAPVLSVSEHTIETVVSDVAADVEDFKDDVVLLEKRVEGRSSEAETRRGSGVEG